MRTVSLVQSKRRRMNRATQSYPCPAAAAGGGPLDILPEFWPERGAGAGTYGAAGRCARRWAPASARPALLPGSAMPTTFPAQYTATPAMGAEIGTGVTPDDCALYDSWCGYCAMHSDADLCTLFVPAHLVPPIGPMLATPGASASPSPSTGAVPPPPSSAAVVNPTFGAMPPATPAGAGSSATVDVMQNSSVGPHLVHSRGMTLYVLNADVAGSGESRA